MIISAGPSKLLGSQTLATDDAAIKFRTHVGRNGPVAVLHDTKKTVTDSLPTSLQDVVGGSFHKTALLQKRVRELIKGAIPLIETREKNPIRIAFLELQRGLIELTPEEDPVVVPPPVAAVVPPAVAIE